MVPRSGIVLGPDSRCRITVSGALLRRGAETLIRAADGARTYTVPDTVCDIQREAFRNGEATKAVRLSRRMKDVDVDLFENSTVQNIICFDIPRNMY